jgi:serine/threonine protein kinase
MYRGRLGNGIPVTIRTLKIKRSQTTQSFNRHIETISRLRHQHLVSALGHCFEYDLDDSIVTQLYLVFEYVQNGNLRSRISRKLPVSLASVSLVLTIQPLNVMLLSELNFTRSH